MLIFPLLSMLPDVDVFWVGCGVADVGLWGHRGITHTPFFAAVVGALVALLGRGSPGARVRLGLAVALVLGSHGLLDALARDGRGIFLLWPLSMDRFSFLWRPIPDAPTGLAFFSIRGLFHLLIELCFFLPLAVYALWPRRTRRQAFLSASAWKWARRLSMTSSRLPSRIPGRL